MAIYLSIAIGGSLGAITRYWLSTLIQHTSQYNFPLGTFLVNVAGSLLIGVFFVIFAEKVSLDAQWRPVIIVGFLGAMTTFSSFSLEALLLLEQGLYNTALLYIVSSVLICLLAAFAGMQITRMLF